MNAKPLETLYSVEEAAKKLGGVSKFTIYAWMSRGTLERTESADGSWYANRH